MACPCLLQARFVFKVFFISWDEVSLPRLPLWLACYEEKYSKDPLTFRNQRPRIHMEGAIAEITLEPSRSSLTVSADAEQGRPGTSNMTSQEVKKRLFLPATLRTEPFLSLFTLSFSTLRKGSPSGSPPASYRQHKFFLQSLASLRGTWGFAVMRCWCNFNAVMRWIKSQLAVLQWF